VDKTFISSVSVSVIRVGVFLAVVAATANLGWRWIFPHAAAFTVRETAVQVCRLEDSCRNIYTELAIDIARGQPVRRLVAKVKDPDDWKSVTRVSSVMNAAVEKKIENLEPAIQGAVSSLQPVRIHNAY